MKASFNYSMKGLRLDKSEWIARYNPLRDSSGEFITYDVVEDLEFINGQDQENIWTEIWDFDSEKPFLVAGCVLDENGGILWYLCKEPWSEEDMNVVEWEES